MMEAECRALLVYANQIDARIQLNDATADVWWMALSRLDFEQAKYCIKVYYAMTNPNTERGLAALSPAMLRHRVAAERDRAAAKRSAIAARPANDAITGESPNAGRLRALLADTDSFKVPD